jgi:hypothetical protein
MGKIKISKGGSVLSDIGKELLPVAKELGVALIKKKAGLGLRHIPVHLAKHHITKLRKGGEISISPKMIKEGASHIVHMLPEKAQDLVEAIGSSKPFKYAMSHGEKLLKKGGEVEIVKELKDDAELSESDEEEEHHQRGGKLNFKGVMGDIGRTLKPVAKELAPVATDIAKEVGVALLKKKAGLGIKKHHAHHHHSTHHEEAHHRHHTHHAHHGMGLYPAGGGLYPAGLHGGMIQLGSPYVGVYSPAFQPYFNNHNPFHQTSPITGGKIKGSDVLHGISQGLQTVAPLLPLMLL